MTSTLVAFAQAIAGVVVFAIFFLPSGFLVGNSLNIGGFRERSTAEKYLWSQCLALPLTIEICVCGGRFFSVNTVVAVLITLAVVAFVRLCRLTPTAVVENRTRRTISLVVLFAGLVGLYLAFASVDIQVGRHLYVSTVIYDWSVRVPMVEAAMRSGVPPINGLSALDGHPAGLRYFYFWYVVCADVARALHLPARASLAASCVWACWTLLSVFFLFLKYVLGVRRNLRLHCALSFLVLSVMGMDLIPTFALLAVRKLHPYAEIEWWHQDRTPSLLSSALYAPHHVAAFACLLAGLLVLSLTLRAEGERPTNGQVTFAALFAGVCFASAAGCSILPTLTVAIICLVWLIDLMLRREWRTVAALAGSAATALLLAKRFLQELTATNGAVSGSFVSLRWRNYDFVRGYQAKYQLVSHHAVINQAIVQGGVLAINLFDLGFSAFVLVHQLRRDSRRKLNGQERMMWALLIGTAIPYFFLSSASIASPNDLGVDAGMLLRLLLQMWAVPWMYRIWVEWRGGVSPLGSGGSWWRRAGLVLAGACMAVGLVGEAFQVVWERVYFPLVGSQRLAKQMDVMTTDRLADRLYNIREAYRGLDEVESNPAAIIQYNPIGTMQMAMTFYATHQIAALDIGCGTGYGGDYAACGRVMPGLLALYGNTRAGFERGRGSNDRQDGAAARTASAEDAVAACRELHLAALVVESTDSIWRRKDSWVWTMTPLLANETVRVFRCPRPFDDGSVDDNVPDDLR